MQEVELHGIRTCVPQMKQLLDSIRRFAPLDTAILVNGETGTGKELVARALHALSHRAGKTLLTIDCAALHEGLAESELFGHERGAFTGADRAYAGRIEAASSGTLFLDEVNSVSVLVQAKLLRFLEQHEIVRVGQQRPMVVDVRVIAATNVPLEQLVAAGTMRADFFYRLNVLTLNLPPLRERLDDLPLLVRQFLAEDPLARKCGVTDVADEVLARLRELPWPGNVRELRNLLRRGVVLGAEANVLRRIDHLVTGSGGPPVTPTAPEVRSEPHVPGRFRPWIKEREREYLLELRRRHTGPNEQAVASGLPQRTLHRKMRNLQAGQAPDRGGRAAIGATA